MDGFRSWESCPAPLSVVITRDVYADGHEDLWTLLDTQPLGGPARSPAGTSTSGLPAALPNPRPPHGTPLVHGEKCRRRPSSLRWIPPGGHLAAVASESQNLPGSA
jgi:hypothetical protein